MGNNIYFFTCLFVYEGHHRRKITFSGNLFRISWQCDSSFPRNNLILPSHHTERWNWYFTVFRATIDYHFAQPSMTITPITMSWQIDADPCSLLELQSKWYISQSSADSSSTLYCKSIHLMSASCGVWWLTQ